ncbi:MAG: hypothetical protein NTX72_02985 [Candidatus Uhrbacteria bacterium]|nr:hypothetical protein [Candidatus Uhrbacteria bacterium]
MMLTEKDRKNAPHNSHGGLTLVPMPGFEVLATELKTLIEEKHLSKESLRARNKSKSKKITPVDIAIPFFGERPSGEPYVQLGKDHIGGHDCFILTSGPGTCEMTMRLIYLVGYLASRKADRITIVSGYFPLGRSDKDEGDKELAMPPFLIQAIKGVDETKLLHRIIAADPHSDQVVMAGGRGGLITPIYLTQLILENVVKQALNVSDKICLAFPDDTAAKRFEKVLAPVEEKLGITFAVVSTAARRKSGSVKNVKYIVGDTDQMKDALVLSLDDEIATGTTNINAALRFVNDFGAKEVWAIATHGVLCGDAVSRFLSPTSPIKRVIITNTIPVESRPELQPLIDAGILSVITWTEELSLILYYDHWNMNIRETR